MLTLWDDLRWLQAVSRMGIDAYLTKSSSAEELVATIDAALGHDPGEKNVVVSMPRSLLQRLDGESASGLSERETEVVVLAARGLSNRMISEELHISEATVKRHMASIYQKVGVHSRNEAVRKASRSSGSASTRSSPRPRATMAITAPTDRAARPRRRHRPEGAGGLHLSGDAKGGAGAGGWVPRRAAATVTGFLHPRPGPGRRTSSGPPLSHLNSRRGPLILPSRAPYSPTFE